MAVPPIQPTRAVATGPTGLVRTLRVSLMLDVVLGLLVAVALPLAILAIPNTISVVAALLPPDVSQIEMIRAHGMALPAMVLTVPLAAMALRRVRAAPILVAGLALLAFADAAGGYAASTTVVGALRLLHGIGAGLLVSATLVAVWERSRLLRAVWAGVLAVSLLTAQALALWPLDEVDSWKVTLQPYPILTGVALVLAALYLVLWRRSGEGVVIGFGRTVSRRGRLLTEALPAVGIAALAVGSTFDWSPGLVVLTASLSILALLGLASVGVVDGVAGRAPAYTMLAVGVVILPTAAQVTYIELGGLGGPGLSGLWPAFTIAGVAGLLAAVLANRLGDGAMPMVTAGGLVVVVAGLCAVRLLLPASGGLMLILPFVLLAVGASVALTGALRPAGGGAALFALSLFFPAVLGGFLLGSGIQVTRLKEATTPQALVDGFVGALHLWALVGGGLVVAVIALGAALVRLSPAAAVDMTAASATTGAAREGSPSWPEVGPEREWRPEPGPRPGPRPGPGPGPERTTAPPVVVPPPAPSPEDDPGNGPVHP